MSAPRKKMVELPDGTEIEDRRVPPWQQRIILWIPVASTLLMVMILAGIWGIASTERAHDSLRQRENESAIARIEKVADENQMLISGNVKLQINNCRTGNVAAALDRWVREHVLGYDAPGSILTRRLRPIRNCAATVKTHQTVILDERLATRTVHSVVCQGRLPIYNVDGDFRKKIPLPGEDSTKQENEVEPEECGEPIPTKDEVDPL